MYIIYNISLHSTKNTAILSFEKSEYQAQLCTIDFREPSVPLKGRGHSSVCNEIGLRVPLRAYGACVVRFLFLLWVFLRFLYFFSSFLCSVFLRVLPYSYFLMFNCSFFSLYSVYQMFFQCFSQGIYTVIFSREFSIPGIRFSSSKRGIQPFHLPYSRWRPTWS